MFLKYMLLFVMLFTALRKNKQEKKIRKTNGPVEELAIMTLSFCKYAVLCSVSPACILNTVNGSLALLLPALHISLSVK